MVRLASPLLLVATLCVGCAETPPAPADGELIAQAVALAQARAEQPGAIAGPRETMAAR